MSGSDCCHFDKLLSVHAHKLNGCTIFSVLGSKLTRSPSHSPHQVLPHFLRKYKYIPLDQILSPFGQISPALVPSPSAQLPFACGHQPSQPLPSAPSPFTILQSRLPIFAGIPPPLLTPSLFDQIPPTLSALALLVKYSSLPQNIFPSNIRTKHALVPGQQTLCERLVANQVTMWSKEATA